MNSTGSVRSVLEYLEANIQGQQELIELIESQSQTIMQFQTTHIPPLQQPTRTQNTASSVRSPSIPSFLVR